MRRLLVVGDSNRQRKRTPISFAGSWMMRRRGLSERSDRRRFYFVVAGCSWRWSDF